MDLRQNSFDVLDISTDSFYQEFIDLESAIVPLINDALEMGFRVSVNVCYIELIREAYTISTLAFLLKNKGTLHIRAVSKFGNARKNNLGVESGVNGKFECQAAGEVCVRYDGQVFICCGPPLVYNISDFCLGNIMSGIEKVQAAYTNNKLIVAMYNRTWDKIINSKLCDEIVFNRLKDKLVLTRRGKESNTGIIVFNETGKWIVENIIYFECIDDLINALAKVTDTEYNDIYSDVIKFVDLLVTNHIVESV